MPPRPSSDTMRKRPARTTPGAKPWPAFDEGTAECLGAAGWRLRRVFPRGWRRTVLTTAVRWVHHGSFGRASLLIELMIPADCGYAPDHCDGQHQSDSERTRDVTRRPAWNPRKPPMLGQATSPKQIRQSALLRAVLRGRSRDVCSRSCSGSLSAADRHRIVQSAYGASLRTSRPQAGREGSQASGSCFLGRRSGRWTAGLVGLAPETWLYPSGGRMRPCDPPRPRSPHRSARSGSTSRWA